MFRPRKRSRGSKRRIQLFFRRLGDFFSPFADGFRRASTGVKAAILAVPPARSLSWYAALPSLAARIPSLPLQVGP